MGMLIRLATRSRYDHCFTYVGRGKIIEAQPDGARLSDLSEYDGLDMVWSDTAAFQPSAAQRAQIVAKAYTQIGVPYGFADIVWIALRCLGIRAPWLLRRVQDERRLICSQLVASDGMAALPPVTPWLCGNPDASMVTPGALARRAR
jgi:hypothetical protein